MLWSTSTSAITGTVHTCRELVGYSKHINRPKRQPMALLFADIQAYQSYMI